MSLSFEDATTRVLKMADLAAPVTSPRISIVVVEGPDAGQRFDIEDASHRRVLLGKSPACDVRLTDNACSRRHLSFELDGASVVLKDLGSANGTFVGALNVKEVVLTGGELVRVGTTVFRIELGTDEKSVPASTEGSFGRIVGASPAMRRLYPMFELLAQQATPVLIEGEAGTGKELVAEALHEMGPRKDGPYLVFDRGTRSPAEVEAALFGNDTADGSIPTGPGLLEQCRGGTLLIDELADLDLPIQLKLLRALEKRSLRRIGGNDPIELDVRCIAATRKNLDHLVTARKFREELLAFFSVARVELPPLRHRRGDIALLTRFFWARYGADPANVPQEVLERFEDQSWPGNVRQLANAVAHELVPGAPAPEAAATPTTADFIDTVVRESLPLAQVHQRVMTELDRRYVRHMLALHKGNTARAAAAAGVTRRYFYTLRAK